MHGIPLKSIKLKCEWYNKYDSMDKRHIQRILDVDVQTSLTASGYMMQ